MKIKSQLIAVISIISCIASANAATIIISNANDGLTDTLYADSNNIPLSVGVVASGYFPASITTSDIDTIPELLANLNDFTTVTSISFGSNSGTLGGTFDGYADQFPTPTIVPGSPILAAPLLNRVIYTIVWNTVSQADATEFALFQSGVLVGDDPNIVEITVTPAGVTPIIGGSDMLTGDLAGQGSGTFNTLTLVAVPEPSTALLGAIGVLMFLRRKR